MSTDTITLDAEKKIDSVQAVYSLAMAGIRNPELKSREASARVDFAAAIMTMDEISQEVDEGRSPASLLMLAEMEVETLKLAYAQALADFLRGYVS